MVQNEDDREEYLANNEDVDLQGMRDYIIIFKRTKDMRT